MNKIVAAHFIGPDIKQFEIEAPRIAEKRKAGQFIILRVHENGERIPLTIADADTKEGTITIIVQGIGKTTKALNKLTAGDEIQDLVGPLGKASEIEYFGTTVCIGGGVGTAIAYPTAKALKEAGNRVISIIGGRTKEHIILENEMEQVADEVFATTDDGSYGFHGFVTDKLQQLIDTGETIDFVLAIGPIPMMKAVSDLTKKYGIKTVVSLNPIMVDGTGMCGGCRAIVDGETVFVCVEGPEFDAHKVDFEILAQRNQTYQQQEQKALQKSGCRTEAMFTNGVKSDKIAVEES